MTTRRLFVSLLCLTFAGTLAAQDLVLRFSPEPGMEYAFGIEQDQDMVMNLGPMGEQKMNTNSRFEMRWAALDRAENGDTRMRMYFDRLVMSVSQGEMTIMTLDTDEMGDNVDEGTRALADAMTWMMSSEMVATVSPLGELVGITGFEGLWETMREKAGDSPEMQQLFGVIEQGFSEENLAQQLRQTFPVFPEHSVKKGDSWDYASTSSNPMVGTIEMASTYTVGDEGKAGERPCRELLVKTDVEMGGDSEMIEQLGQMTGADLEFSIEDVVTNGTLCVDYTTGLPIASQMEVAAAIQMGMTMNESEQPEDAETPSRIDMHIALEGDVTVELLSVKKIEGE